jgi:hypothetical protein
VIVDTRGADEKALRKAFRKAYPFVQKRGWKYRVWLQEIERQQDEYRRFLRWQTELGALDDQVIEWLRG